MSVTAPDFAAMREAMPNFAQMREAMVLSQLRTCDVNDPKVLTAIRSVAREAFVAPEQAATCYHDRAVPLSAGRALNPPLVLGRMLVEAMPKASDTVLIIGGGTGYSAAVIAPLVQSVVMVESDAELAAKARANLSAHSEITVIDGALTDGHAAGAPYDLILIDGAVEEVSAALADQLADDGRLVTGVVEGAVTRLAMGRKAGGVFGLVAFADMDVTPLAAFQRERSFQF